MRNRQLGMTMVEVVIVLSVFVVLAAASLPTVRAARRNASELVPCEIQLTEIGAAIKKYQLEHQGRLPWPIGRLVSEDHLGNEQMLVCPVLRKRLPGLVAKERAAFAAARKPPWSSYFMFSQRHLDRMKDRGRIAFGYGEVLRRRGGDTPLVICHEHRDHVEFRRSPGQPDEQVVYWDDPEQPLLVLRFDGRVTRQNKPGSRVHSDTLFGSQQLLAEF